MATIYKWDRYALNSAIVYEAYKDGTGTTTYRQGSQVAISRSYTIDQTYKVFKLDGYSSITIERNVSSLVGRYFPHSMDYVYYGTSYSNTYKIYYDIYRLRETTQYSKGDYIDTVESENSNAYPNDKQQGDYWYVYAGSEEVFEPTVFTTIGGVQRKLSAVPVNVGGVQRELSSLLATVDGVAREIFSSVKYTWEKYTCVECFVASGQATTVNISGTTTVGLYNGSTPDSGTTTIAFNKIKAGNYFRVAGGQIYRADTDATFAFSTYTITATPVAPGTVKGDYIGTVESDDASTYPENGAHTDGYWYVLVRPTITFTIQGLSYTAEEGMTFAEWVESDYDNGWFYIYNNTVCGDGGDPIVGATPTTVIQADSIWTFG